MKRTYRRNPLVRVRQIAFETARNERSLQKYGCDWTRYILLRGVTTRRFIEQRRNANTRGIGWNLNLWQWWSIWQQSGHWAERGRGQGYVMCRRGDVGPYALGNVFIASARQNHSETRHKKSGLPIGVDQRKSKFRAVREIGGKRFRLGIFDTPELAHAAYLAFAAPAETETAS